MPGKLGSLTIDIGADVAQLRRDMSSAERTIKGSTDKIAASARTARRALGGIVGILGGTAFTSKIIDATRKQEAAVKQLEQGLVSTGGVVGRSLDELTKKASELQNVTTFGDEDIIAAQSRLLTFTNILGDNFDRTTEAALDLATRMGTDLNSASLQLGKALNDPVKNLSALSRAGIQFSESQTDTIKALAETGRLAEAQTIILAELETQFGGSAKAARETFGGALDALGNAFGDLLEADRGGLNDATESLNEFTSILQDPRTVEAANNLATGIINAFSGVVGILSSTVNGITELSERLAINIFGLAVDDIENINKAIAGTEFNIEQLRKQLSEQFGSADAAINIAPNFEGVQQLDAAIAKLEQLKNLKKIGEELTAPKTTQPADEDGETVTATLDVAGLQDELKELDKILEQRNKAIEAANKKLEAAGASITASVLTEEEQYRTGKKELDELLGKGIITQETYNRKLTEYKDILDQATPGIQSFGELQEALTGTLSPQETALAGVRDQMTLLLGAMDQFPERADDIAAALDNLQSRQREILNSSFDEIPSFSGLSPEIGGAFGEFNKLDDERDKINKWYDEQLTILSDFRESRADLNEEWDEKELELKQNHSDALAEIDRAREFVALTATEDLFGSLAELAQKTAGEQSGVYRTLFAIEKAAAIARATIAIQTGIAQAAAQPFPTNLAAIASVASATAGIISTIQGTELQSFDGGGYTGSGPRAGGLDGRGGFIAMLHPDETVIDHTVVNRGNSSYTVNQNINVAPTYDNRTAHQIANESARSQRLAQARFSA